MDSSSSDFFRGPGDDFSVSVVIPFYQAYDFFAQALESVYAQTFPPAEIIVVNDGCGEKAERFLSEFDGIRVHSLQVNRGVSSARNTGVALAKNEWIAFLDADDIWKPDKLEKQVAFLREHREYSSCHTGVETFNPTGVLHTYVDKPRFLSISDLLVSSHVVPSSFVLRKEVFDRLDGFDVRMKCSEDHDLSIRILQSGEKIGFIGETLIGLRRAEHGNLSSSGRKQIIGHWQLLKKHWASFRHFNRSRSYFMYKTFMSAGGKAGGVEGKFYYLLGRALKPFGGA